MIFSTFRGPFKTECFCSGGAYTLSLRWFGFAKASRFVEGLPRGFPRWPVSPGFLERLEHKAHKFWVKAKLLLQSQGSTGKTKRTAHLQPKHVGACSPLGIRPEFSQRQQLKKRDLQRTQLSYDKAKPNGNHKALTAAQERAWPCQARSPRRSSSPRLEQTKRTSRERAGGGGGTWGDWGVGGWGQGRGKGPGGMEDGGGAVPTRRKMKVDKLWG